jgi:hypothetical protein
MKALGYSVIFAVLAGTIAAKFLDFIPQFKATCQSSEACEFTFRAMAFGVVYFWVQIIGLGVVVGSAIVDRIQRASRK